MVNDIIHIGHAIVNGTVHCEAITVHHKAINGKSL